jgi:redox-sensitive bicupin YhaK (pirin superfamily)
MEVAPARPYVILDADDHTVLGESQFGMAGLTAVESVGPFVSVQALGPLITVHDSVIDAGMGIGHHPHRHNERLFYIEEGQLDHDDARNGITGHMDAGDVGQFTEGRGGMIHSEWNHGDVHTRAYILVYTTDPIPEQTAFNVLKDAEAPRYGEGRGVRTKELIGIRSPLRVHGDVRLFTDSQLDADAHLSIPLAVGEGGLASVREGAVVVDDEQKLTPGATLLIPPAENARAVGMRATEPSRVVRVVCGRGNGLVLNERAG